MVEDPQAVMLGIDFESVSQNVTRSFQTIDSVRFVIPSEQDIVGPIDYYLLEDDKGAIIDRGGNKVSIVKDGKFRYNLGSIGRGPGEYVEIINFSTTTDGTLLLLVDDGATILRFTTDGNFLKKERLDENSKSLIVFDGELYSRAIDVDAVGRTFIRHYVGSSLINLIIPAPIISIPVQEANFSRTENHSLIYFESFNNCIYKLSNSQVFPIYCFDYGDLSYNYLAEGEDDVSKFLKIRESGMVRVIDFQQVSDRYDAFIFAVEKIDDIEFYGSLYDKSEESFEVRALDSDEYGRPIFHNLFGHFVFFSSSEILDSQEITLLKVSPLEIF